MKPPIKEADSRLKIAMVFYANPDGYPPTLNAVRLLSEKYRVILICRNIGKPSHHYPANVEIHRLGRNIEFSEHSSLSFFEKLFSYSRFCLKTFSCLISSRVSLIYAFDMHALIPAFAGARFGKRRPLIYHNHDLTDDRVRGLSRLVMRLQYVLAPRADLVVFPESHRADWFKTKAGLKRRAAIVWNAPLRKNNLPEGKLRKSFKVSEDVKPLILYQGSVGPSHGLEALMKALERLPQALVVLLGPIRVEGYLKELKRLAGDHSERVLYAGEVPYEEVLSYTVDADIGAALYEDTGVNQKNNASASCKIFEYLSAGIPVLTSDFDSFRDFFKDLSCVKFAKPDDADAVTRAIDEIRNTPEKFQMAREEARRLHLERYNYESCFEKVLGWIENEIEGAVRE